MKFSINLLTLASTSVLQTFNMVKLAQKLPRKAKLPEVVSTEKCCSKRQKLLKSCRAQSGHSYSIGGSENNTFKKSCFKSNSNRSCGFPGIHIHVETQKERSQLVLCMMTFTDQFHYHASIPCCFCTLLPHFMLVFF